MQMLKRSYSIIVDSAGGQTDGAVASWAAAPWGGWPSLAVSICVQLDMVVPVVWSVLRCSHGDRPNGICGFGRGGCWAGPEPRRGPPATLVPAGWLAVRAAGAAVAADGWPDTNTATTATAHSIHLRRSILTIAHPRRELPAMSEPSRGRVAVGSLHSAIIGWPGTGRGPATGRQLHSSCQPNY